MLEKQRIAMGGRHLNVARGAANGPPLLFLHGVTRRWQSFTPLIPTFNPHWQIHALDFRGHGESDRVPNSYRVVDYVDDAVGYLEQLDEPAVVYGHSLGAMVTAAVAGRIPDKVRAIVLEDPPFHTMGERIKQTAFHSLFLGFQNAHRNASTFEEMCEAVAEIRVQGPDDTDAVRVGDVRTEASIWFTAQSLLQLDPEALVPIVESRWLDGYDLPAVCRGIECPVLLLQADYDHGGMLTPDDAHDMAHRLSSLMWTSRPVEFPETPHLIHWTATEELILLLQEFLETV